MKSTNLLSDMYNDSISPLIEGILDFIDGFLKEKKPKEYKGAKIKILDKPKGYIFVYDSIPLMFREKKSGKLYVNAEDYSRTVKKYQDFILSPNVVKEQKKISVSAEKMHKLIGIRYPFGVVE